MGNIVAIANQKGGVGKTTLAVNLAVWLARQGRRVVLVDGDPQANATSWITGVVPEQAGLFEVLVAKQPIHKAIKPVTGLWNVGLLPGNMQTGDTMIILAALRSPFDTISNALRPLVKLVDHVVIDMPPSVTAGFRELLYAADWVIVPTQVERLSLEGVVFMARTCHDLASGNGNRPRLLGIVPNLVRRGCTEHIAQLAELAEMFSERVWPVMPQSIVVCEASSRGMPMFDYAPEHEVTTALAEIGRRVIENGQ